MTCTSGHFQGFRMLLRSAVVFLLIPGFVAAQEDGSEPIDYSSFEEAVRTSDDAAALAAGEVIFGKLDARYRNDAGFVSLKSKLTASGFLASQMESQLKQATSKRMRAMADEVFAAQPDSQNKSMQIAPAKRLYESSTQLFSKPITIPNLTQAERRFLATYYDLRLRGYSTALAKAGQALAVAEPAFKGTYDYVMVLPLLHASDKQPVKADVLPRWMQRSVHLDLCSDSCLLHFGMPYQAMELARQSAATEDRPFSELAFYRSASQKCGVPLSHVAVECLTKALEFVPPDHGDQVVALKFEIVQLWLVPFQFNEFYFAGFVCCGT
jgi:hypothetical protein